MPLVPAKALTVLGRALVLAEPEGYIRLFLDEGAPMVTFIDIMNAVALDLHKATLERIELFIKPLRACYRARDGGASVARDRRVFHRHKYTSCVSRSALGLLPTCLRWTT